MKPTLPLLLLALLPAFAHADDNVAAAESHTEAVKVLDAFITRQVEQHKLPALSIALVEGENVVWAKGYGFEDAKKKVPASAKTVYRAGSISKLFTDLAIMQLAEQKKLDLDTGVTRYIPDFQPRNTSGKDITLRQLMSHRSGLMREPPIGSYFDPTFPSLEKTVQSLNGMPLIHKPEEKTKYSNAAIAVVGYVLEKQAGEPFVKAVQKAMLDPMKMSSSAFEPTPAVKERLAQAIMWTYPGREFPAPTFELGMIPAGSLYSSVLDLSRFAQVLFRKGQLDNGKQLVKAETLEAMYKPQFTKSKDGFGLGFMVNEWKGKFRVGHNGAVYGFAADLSVLPNDKLAVAVISSCDCANAVSTRLADVSLEMLVAVKEKKKLPTIEETKPIEPKEARQLAGRYQNKERGFDLIESGGKLYLLPTRGGFRLDVRRLGNDLITDGRLGYGLKIEPTKKGLKVGKDTYPRVEMKKPADLPAKWRGLIGEYGDDHIKLVILEKDGKLHAQIEWFFVDPLEEETEDVYRFPVERGLYTSEKLVFSRDKEGKGIEVSAAGMMLKRRTITGEDGGTFTIKPLKPIDELRKIAMKATPPEERTGLLRKAELVDLVKLDKSIKVDIRYASTNNFLSTAFYKSAKAYLQKPAAEALVRVHQALEKQGYGLMIHDGYRPWSVTKMFHDATPDDLKIFVADPAKGSRHNRGCAVDLTLYDRKTGQVIEMPGGYDEMSDRSYPDYLGGTSLQRWHRDLLRRAMEAEGFTVYEAEWWHFDYKDWTKYPIGNQTFEELGGR